MYVSDLGRNYIIYQGISERKCEIKILKMFRSDIHMHFIDLGRNYII